MRLRPASPRREAAPRPTADTAGAAEAAEAACPAGAASGPEPAPETPLYTALAERWAADGRAVPGRDDQEWTKLVGREAWPRR